MLDITTLKIGQKVHYIPFEGCVTSRYENGIIKEIPEFITTTQVRVVYHCAGDWANYMNYTSALTNISQLSLGWFNEDDMNQ